MKELEVEIRLRNNRLKERRLRVGLTQKQLAKKVGISVGVYCHLESMSKNVDKSGICRGSPITSEGGWTKTVEKLAEYYEVPPEELFPNAVITARCNKVVRKYDGEEINLLSGNQMDLLPSSIDQQERRESINYLKYLMENSDLTQRQKEVLDHRMDGKTLKEVGDIYDVSRERIRQLELEAMAKMKGKDVRNFIVEIDGKTYKRYNWWHLYDYRGHGGHRQW